VFTAGFVSKHTQQLRLSRTPLQGTASIANATARCDPCEHLQPVPAEEPEEHVPKMSADQCQGSRATPRSAQIQSYGNNSPEHLSTKNSSVFKQKFCC